MTDLYSSHRFELGLAHGTGGPRRQFATASINVPRGGRSSPRLRSDLFPVLSGFELRYTHGGRDVQLASVNIPGINSRGIAQLRDHARFDYDVLTEVGLRDSTSNFDDSYNGTVRGVVLGIFDETEESTMPVDIRNFTIAFAPRTRSRAVGTATVTVPVPGLTIDRVAAVLRGFTTTYDQGHHLFEMQVDLVPSAVATVGGGTNVTVTGTLGLRDSASAFDDLFGGTINGTLISRIA